MERSLTHRALAALSLAASAALALPAQAGPALVADIDSGRVLYAEDATQPWHPASVTKLMTVYVALRALADGQIGLQTAIPVSKRASLAPPSKIRLKPGQEITLENALKIMMVKSANDVAITIAEGVGGTVENFAAMMNAEAQRLGMTDSHFINPNGLFAAGQQSSARDMALLARALLVEFPEYAALYSIGAVKLGDVVMLNTNGLIGRYPGADGMKTGFICASGFNVVATASRNGRRVVAVVFGEPSAQKRTIKASQLFDRAFNGEFSRGPQLAALQRVGGAPPNLREDICVKRIGREPSENDAPATLTPGASQDDSSRPIMMTSNGAAFATGPREEFTPIAVFIGPSPGSKNAPMAANRKAIPATQTATADKPEPSKAGAPKTKSAKPADSAKTKPAAAPSAKQEVNKKPAANTATKKPAPAAAPAKPAASTPSPQPAAAEPSGGVKPAAAKEAAQPAPDNVGGIGISQSGPASFRGTMPPPSAPKAAPAGGAGPLVLPGAAAPVPSQLVRPAPAQPALKPATEP
jgi:D-alanyl-D-alanine carboxypeptidase